MEGWWFNVLQIFPLDGIVKNSSSASLLQIFYHYDVLKYAEIIEYLYARALRKYPWGAYEVFYESIMIFLYSIFVYTPVRKFLFDDFVSIIHLKIEALQDYHL